MKKRIESHYPVDREMLEAFASLKEVMSVSCVVSDAQERENVMASFMKMRTTDRPFIGTALTVKLTSGMLVDPLQVLELAHKGDVVVIDAAGETETSIWGGLMSGLARAAGIVGVVIDGAARDIDESRMLEFPIVSKAVTPRGAQSAYTKLYDPIEINTEVTCGGVVVRPGDMVVADEIGVTVVPRDNLSETFEKARQLSEQEEKTRAEILKGATFQELLEKFGRI